MSYYNNDTNSINRLRFDESSVKALENIGLRPVGIYQPSNAAGVKWSDAYPDPEFRWSRTTLEIKQDRNSFANYATMFGRTHIKDSETGEYLNLNALDIDCQIVYNRLSVPISNLIDASSWDWVTDKLRDLVKAFLSGTGVITGDYNQTLLDVLKKSTFITKTRKQYGNHIYWLSKKQSEAVGVADCRSGFEFEIKTDDTLGLCTLPGSAHKDDLSFRYTSIGITDHILASDILYDLFLEMFKDCLKVGKLDNDIAGSKESEENPSKENGQKKDNQSISIKNLVILSNSTIRATAGQIAEFVARGYRNEFYLRFSGMLFHARISEESGVKIIARICALTNDEEAKSRQSTFMDTYEKGYKGEEIEGAPKLAELISGKVEGQDRFSATLFLDNIKNLWRIDRKAKHQREKSKLVKVSVEEAKRMQAGYVQVRGNIVGMSTAYQMIKSTRLSCDDCDYNHEIEYDIPQFKPHIKERSRCPHYNDDEAEHRSNDTVVAEHDYLPTVDVLLQDMDKLGDLTRLEVKLFDCNTYNVNTGEIVDIIGHIHVIRKNDSLLNKAESVLFAEEVIYTKRKEIALTEQDKEEIQNWKSDLENEGNKRGSIINKAIELFAPHIIGYNHIKKGILVQCVNAGIKNDEKRLPIRMRVNILIIGDPGTAKGVLTDAALKLIPNCQSVNGIASSGISLVAVVNKDNSGSMSVNLGTLALAKNGIGRINEVGRLKLDQQPHLFDAMEEGTTDMVKYGFPTNIECHVSVLATANPLNNRWKNSTKISMDEFPVLLQISQRFDLIYVTRENSSDEFIDEYVDRRTEAAQNYKNGVYKGDLEKLQKYIAYARTFNPVIPEDIKLLLKYFLKQMAKSDIDGLFRKFDSLLRISIGIAKLRLKSVVDVDDAHEAMAMFQLMLSEFEKRVGIPKDPRDAAYQEIRQITKESYNILLHGIELKETLKKACDRNSQVNDYLKRGIPEGKDPSSLRDNAKVKPILELLRKDPNIIIIGERPIVMKWNPDGHSQSQSQNQTVEEEQKREQSFGKKSLNLSDASDASDGNFSDPHDNGDNSVKSKDQKYPETVPKDTTNTDIHVVPEMKVDFEENADLQQRSSQKGASLTSLASLRIYEVSWMGSNYWACRYCGLKADKTSLEKHDCPVKNEKNEKKD